MALITLIFNRLSNPVAPHKTLGPSPIMEYLSIILDSEKMEARLPQDGKILASGSNSRENSSLMLGLKGADTLLNKTVDLLLQAAHSPPTQSVYLSGWKAFIHFLVMLGRWDHMCDQPSVPIDEYALVDFVVYCFKIIYIRYASIKLYLCSVKYFCVKLGIYHPLDGPSYSCCPRLQMVLRGVKNFQSYAPSTRLPISFDILVRMCTLLKKGFFGPWVDGMLLAESSLAFFAFLRCGEFTVASNKEMEYLHISDFIIAGNNSNGTLVLRASKSDPFRYGVQIRLFPVHNGTCPLMAMNDYLAIRGKVGCLRLSDPLFTTDGINPLSRSVFLEKLHLLLHVLGYPQRQFNGHSFRIGAATAAANAGIEDYLIKTLGRWTSDSYLRYIRTSNDAILCAQQAMCAPTRS